MATREREIGSDGMAGGLRDLLDTYERGLILDALAATGGHQRRTAALLGVLPTTLHEKMKRLGLLPRRRSRRELPSHVFDPGAAAEPREA
jgi:DNA-binding NtrC family response regulator